MQSFQDRKWTAASRALRGSEAERVWSVRAKRPSDWRFGASELAALYEIDRRPKALATHFFDRLHGARCVKPLSSTS
jgi:hypothetical protein